MSVFRHGERSGGCGADRGSTRVPGSASPQKLEQVLVFVNRHPHPEAINRIAGRNAMREFDIAL
jgi:hypothetical protein